MTGRHPQPADAEPPPVPGHHRSAGRGSRTSSATREVPQSSAQVTEGVRRPAAPLGQGRSHVPVAQPNGRGARAGDPHRPEPRGSHRRVTPPEHDERRVEPDVDRPPAQSHGVELARRGRHPVDQRRSGASQRTSAPRTRASASHAPAPGPGEPGRAARAATVPAGSAPGGTRDRQLRLSASLGSRCVRRSSRSSSTASPRPGQSRRHQRLGPVLVADRRADRAQR